MQEDKGGKVGPGDPVGKDILLLLFRNGRLREENWQIQLIIEPFVSGPFCKIFN